MHGFGYILLRCLRLLIAICFYLLHHRSFSVPSLGHALVLFGCLINSLCVHPNWGCCHWVGFLFQALGVLHFGPPPPGGFLSCISSVWVALFGVNTVFLCDFRFGLFFARTIQDLGDFFLSFSLLIKIQSPSLKTKFPLNPTMTSPSDALAAIRLEPQSPRCPSGTLCESPLNRTDLKDT